jgi:DNA-binding transcriptional MerR regulator
LKRVSDLAQQYGVLPSQIRYYIKEGLLSPSDRTPGGHFLFDEEQEQRLQKVFELKEKRYRIKEIRDILNGSEPSDDNG